MARAKSASVSGRDHYAQTFKSELREEAEWLRIGAIEKVNSVALLLKKADLNPESVLELGCGTGAVILECQRRKLASQFTAIDYSSEAIEYLSHKAPGVRCIHADITDPTLQIHGKFDVVILSHVLEHLEDPASLLHAVTTKLRFKRLIVEVPLEDLSAARIKNMMRDRKQNVAGHVQFFNMKSFQRLLIEAGLKIDDTRIYSPKMSTADIEFVSAKDGVSRSKRLFKKAIGVYLPRLFGPLWVNYYYSHMAAICRPSDFNP